MLSIAFTVNEKVTESGWKQRCHSLRLRQTVHRLAHVSWYIIGYSFQIDVALVLETILCLLHNTCEIAFVQDDWTLPNITKWQTNQFAESGWIFSRSRIFNVQNSIQRSARSLALNCAMCWQAEVDVGWCELRRQTRYGDIIMSKNTHTPHDISRCSFRMENKRAINRSVMRTHKAFQVDDFSFRTSVYQSLVCRVYVLFGISVRWHESVCYKHNLSAITHFSD